MRRLNSIIFFLVLCSKISFSQTNSLSLAAFNEKLFQKKKISFSYFNPPSHLVQNSYSFSKSIKQEIRPAFCKMEDKLHKRFNIWITLRAGNDEEYRKLIGERD